MKNGFAAVRHRKVCTLMLVFLSLLVLATSARAAMVFFDDFEDGDHSGWFVSSMGGSSSTGVTEYNESQMAYVQHTGAYNYVLSHDFTYVSNGILSFDMQAVTVGGAYSTDAWAGVTISFLDDFNSTLGYVRLLNNTTGSLGEFDRLVDQCQHSYENSFADFALLAGLDSSAPINTVSLQFWAQAQTADGNNHSWATVWFDDVKVESAPVPPAILLLGSGMIGLWGVRRRQR